MSETSVETLDDRKGLERTRAALENTIGQIGQTWKNLRPRYTSVRKRDSTQVHRATLLNGDEVVVKVQRDGLYTATGVPKCLFFTHFFLLLQNSNFHT